jgi:ribosome-associated translation inhibitor RaiA
LTISCNNTKDKDKDFQEAIEERFNDISDQIRRLQKALANHRHDFDNRYEA